MINFEDFIVPEEFGGLLKAVDEENKFVFSGGTIQVISIETIGGGLVSQDTNVRYTQYVRVWYIGPRMA